MKSCFYIFFIFIFSCAYSYAQAPAWDWAMRYIGTGNDKAYDICADASGNIYMCGSFYSDTLFFGNCFAVRTTSGGESFFLVKFDANENALWVRTQGGGPGTTKATAISIDAANHIHICGSFVGDPYVGTATLFDGYPSMFFASYDANGNFISAGANWGGCQTCKSYAKGYINSASGNYSVGSREFINNTISYYNISISTPGGGQTFGGTNHDYGNAVCADAAGNGYFTGDYSSASITFGSITLTNSGTDDVFLFKTNPAGNILWAKKFGSNGDDVGYKLAADASGNILLTGYFSSNSIQFGNFTLTNENQNSYLYDVFVAKLDTAGNILWAKSFGGSGQDYCSGITSDANDNIFLSGYFGSSSIAIGNTTLTNTSGNQVFLAKMDAAGNVQWAKSAGNPTTIFSGGVAVTSLGNVFVGGYFNCSSVSFDNITQTNTEFNNTSDAFLARLSSPTGVNENNFSPDFNIYPNPSSGIFNLHTDFSGAYDVKIYNSLGEIVFAKENISGNDLPIDLQDESNGIYFLNIVSGEKVSALKIVKTE
ncbi:MAG: T9SS type A sorting domain-containing protein [Bacteroidetes bacterium]|nr:T9SS type A sorting domain-containing protein [Bacteroidota bacterium]